jgi:hypothetical protein
MVRKGKSTEWAVKQAVNKVLESYPESYWFMPVPYGYGKSTVDYLVCHYGLFIGIETKAPGETPTTRQLQILKEIKDAGGEAFVIDGVDKCHVLRVFLEQVKQNAASQSKPQAQDGGGAARGEGSQPVSSSEADRFRGSPAYPFATSPDRDLSVAEDGLRRPKPDPDALRLGRRHAVRQPEIDVGDAVAGAKGVRPERDGDGED